MVWHEFVLEASTLAQKNGIKTLYKSAFYIEAEPVEENCDDKENLLHDDENQIHKKENVKIFSTATTIIISAYCNCNKNHNYINKTKTYQPNQISLSLKNTSAFLI